MATTRTTSTLRAGSGKTATFAQEERDNYYMNLRAYMQNRLNRAIERGDTLFTTAAPNLWIAYLKGFAARSERQYHCCHTCRRFIEAFGNLVTIGEDGATTSVLWGGISGFGVYSPSVRALRRAVETATVTGPFVTDQRTLGTSEAGGWSHFAVTLPSAFALHTSRIRTPHQVVAEKREDFAQVQRALEEFSPAVVAVAGNLLEHDDLYRSEKVRGPAQWLHARHVERAGIERPVLRTNLLWRAVATAPAGFCHPRTSMIGTLLEDLAGGYSVHDAAKRFGAKMHPLSYQRPTAAPKAGTIDQAERLFEQLGLARSLARRFATLADIQPHAIWMPADARRARAPRGLFGYLSAGQDMTASSDTPTEQRITFARFRATILPHTSTMWALPPFVRAPFCAFLTAVHADAPPLLQWDSPTDRNPVSWYFWQGGMMAKDYGLTPYTRVPVDAVTLKPSQWGGGSPHQGVGAFFALQGARESKQPSLCLFPEMLRTELHGVRAVIEKYSSTNQPTGLGTEHVAGLMFDSSSAAWDLHVQVHMGTVQRRFHIDRWE